MTIVTVASPVKGRHHTNFFGSLSRPIWLPGASTIEDLELRANKTAARLLVPLQPMTQKISRLSAPFWPSPKNAVLFFDGTCDVCMDLHGKHCFFWNIMEHHDWCFKKWHNHDYLFETSHFEWWFFRKRWLFFGKRWFQHQPWRTWKSCKIRVRAIKKCSTKLWEYPSKKVEIEHSKNDRSKRSEHMMLLLLNWTHSMWPGNRYSMHRA